MNLKDTPFSYFGAYFCISYKKDGLYLRSLRGKSKNHMNTIKIVPLYKGEPAQYTYEACPSHIDLFFQGCTLSICFNGPEKLLFWGKGAGAGLALDTQPVYNFEYSFLLGTAEQPYVMVNSYKNLTKLLIYCPGHTSKLHLDQEIRIDAAGSMDRVENKSVIFIEPQEDEFSCIVQDVAFNGAVPAGDSFDFAQAKKKSKEAFVAYCEKLPPVTSQDQGAKEAAAYICWSSFVRPEGNLKRYAMYASNDAFPGVWSWDHCFNALALAGVDNGLAWDQMQVIFDEQDPLGQVPGSVSDSTLRWNFSKPPVQGVFYHKMARKMEFSQKQWEQMFQQVRKQVQYYLNYKDANHDGICEYHHGNDSGQDNSTAFMGTECVDSPDLTAFLILSMDFLAQAAKVLGDQQEAEDWKRQADMLTQFFCNYFLKDDIPILRRSRDGAEIPTRSLLPLMSLVLGKRLPEEARNKMVSCLRKHYLTPWGIATEALDSPLYAEDAYWRGPIWAPTTLLLCEALEDCGEQELGREIEQRFCRLVREQGLAENFNALTGAPLRDKSFTWTASTFLYLAAKQWEKQG